MAIHKLSVAKVNSLLRSEITARKGDGGGLYCDLQGTTGGFWLFRFKRFGRSKYLSIGPTHSVSLAAARQAAADFRAAMRAGRDPIAVRKATRAAQKLADANAKTFNELVEEYIAAHESEWSNQKTRGQWINSLRTYVSPVLGSVLVRDVDTPLIVRALSPIWVTKQKTATAIRGRIEKVLGAAIAQGFMVGPNPARWKDNLDTLLAARTKGTKRRHPALPFDQIGEFMVGLRARPGIAARALELTILCATRSGDVAGQKSEDKPPCRWQDIDLGAQTWTVPKSKTGKEHIVPLCAAAIDILNQMAPLRTASDVVFVDADGPLGRDAMADVLAEMNNERTAAGLPQYTDPKQDGRAVVVHGFRSTFRDWASECTNFPNEVCEMALAHKIKSEVEASYRRGELLMKRRKLLDAWAAFTDTQRANVIPLPTADAKVRKQG